MKKIISFIVVFVLVLLTINTTNAYLSKNQAYGNIKDAFYTLEINEKISKQDRDFLVEKFHIALYEKGKNPDETYDVAMQMYYKLNSRVRSYLSIVSEYNDYYIDNNDCDREYGYNTYSKAKKDKYYKKIRNLFYRAYNNGFINKTVRKNYINYYYKDIYKYDRNPYTVYKKALEKYNYFEEKSVNNDREDRYYKRIKDLFYSLYNKGIITSKQRKNYINYYYKDIYTYDRNPYTVYKKALDKYNNLKDDSYYNTNYSTNYINTNHNINYNHNYNNNTNYSNNHINTNHNYYNDDENIFIDNNILNFGNHIDYTGRYLKYYREY